MKKYFFKYGIAIAVLLLGIVFGCKKEDPEGATKDNPTPKLEVSVALTNTSKSSSVDKSTIVLNDGDVATFNITTDASSKYATVYIDTTTVVKYQPITGSSYAYPAPAGFSVANLGKKIEVYIIAQSATSYTQTKYTIEADYPAICKGDGLVSVIVVDKSVRKYKDGTADKTASIADSLYAISDNDVFMVGSFGSSGWTTNNPTYKMKKVVKSIYCIPVKLVKGNKFKFSRGSWDFVEKQIIVDQCIEQDNRKYDGEAKKLIININGWRKISKECGKN